MSSPTWTRPNPTTGLATAGSPASASPPISRRVPEIRSVDLVQRRRDRIADVDLVARTAQLARQPAQPRLGRPAAVEEEVGELRDDHRPAAR